MLDEDARYGRVGRGDELPAELARRETRLARIRRGQAGVGGAGARARPSAEGGALRRKGPAQKTRMQYNFTDPESRIMPGADGFVLGLQHPNCGGAGFSS